MGCSHFTDFHYSIKLNAVIWSLFPTFIGDVSIFSFLRRSVKKSSYCCCNGGNSLANICNMNTANILDDLKVRLWGYLYLSQCTAQSFFWSNSLNLPQSMQSNEMLPCSCSSWVDSSSALKGSMAKSGDFLCFKTQKTPLFICLNF